MNIWEPQSDDCLAALLFFFLENENETLDKFRLFRKMFVTLHPRNKHKRYDASESDVGISTAPILCP